MTKRIKKVGKVKNVGKIKKVVLIQPPDPEGTIVIRDHMGKFGILEKKTSVIRVDVFPPLDLAFPAALLEEDGFDVSIIDSPTLELDRSKLLREVVSKNPDLIIVNTCGVTISNDLDLASWLKNTLEMEVVAIAPTYIPEDVLEKKDIDVFVYGGETEHTILELCQKYPIVKNIKGIFYRKGKREDKRKGGRKGGRFIYNPKRPLIKSLDELPMPAYHLLPMGKYSNHMFKRKRFTTAQTSRGCPFGCIYCLYPLGCGDVWRGRSPEGVLAELKMLEDEHKIKSILFRDQVFNFNLKRAEKICDGMIKEGIDIEWRCEARVDFLPKILMVKMKRAGCAGVHMGIESGDLAILKTVAKGGVSADHIDKVKKVFREAREIDLEALAFFMIGFPGETKESISKTFELAKELKAKRAWFCPVVPYPGTNLYEIAKRKGWLLTEGLEDYTGRKVVMRTDQLTEEDIREAVDVGNIMFSKDKTQLLKTVFSSQGVRSMLLDPKKALKFTLGRFFKKNW